MTNIFLIVLLRIIIGWVVDKFTIEETIESKPIVKVKKDTSKNNSCKLFGKFKTYIAEGVYRNPNKYNNSIRRFTGKYRCRGSCP